MCIKYFAIISPPPERLFALHLNKIAFNINLPKVICAHIFQIGLNVLKINYEKINEKDGDIDDEHPTFIDQKSSHKPLANLRHGD